MVKSKLILGSILAAALMGCGGNKEDSSRKDVDHSAVLEGNLVVEEPLDLNIHLHFKNMYAYDENWPVAREIAKETNVNLKNTASRSSTNSAEAFNVMMASGKLPDIVGGDNRMDDFIKYGMEGAFVPLNDLIEEYAPNIKEILDRKPEVKRGITAPDGNIYFIPYIPDGSPVSRGYWVRQDWLDNLGLEQPNTVEELYEVLVAFKTQDPNGNGKADEIPLIIREWHELIRMTTLWGARTAGSDTYVSFYKNKDGDIAHGWREPEFKEGMKHIVKWYNEGLIDKEVFTRGNRTREILFTSNQAGMTRDWMPSTAKFNDALKDDIKGFNLQPMLPPINTTGERVEENRRARLKPDGWAITSVNNHPVETMKYFDFYFSDTGKRFVNFGVEGAHHTLVDGIAQFTEEVLTSDKAVNQQMYDVGALIPIGYNVDPEYEKQWTNEIALKGIDMYDENVRYYDDFIAPTLTTEERQIYDSKWPSIQLYMEENVQKWILQNRDVEKEWDTYVRGLERLGIEDVIEVLRKADERANKV